MATLPGVRRILGWLLMALGLLFLGAAVFLTQTPWGKQWVLREVLVRVDGAIPGTLRVEGVSSPGLLRGFTFRGVDIRDREGRPFLAADSLRGGISPLALLRGDLVFTRVALFSPRVTLERLPGQERFNAERIFTSPTSPDTATGVESPEEAVREEEVREEGGGREGGRTIALRDTRIVDGTLEIFLPLGEGEETGEGMVVVPGPEGRGRLRLLSFRELNLELSRATVAAPGQEGERFQVESLSVLARVWPEAFRIRDLRGVVRRRSGELVASLEELRLPSSGVRASVEVLWGDQTPVRVEARGEAGPLALEDLHWLEPRLPRGEARGGFRFSLAGESLELGFRETDLLLDSGGIGARGTLVLGPELAFRGLDLELEDVPLALTDPWLQEPLPLRGRLGGRLELGGDLDSLAVEGDLDFRDPEVAGFTRARVSGILHVQEELGATAFQATLAPLEWATLRSLSPRMTLQGPGALRVDASGVLDAGLDFSLEATHTPTGRTPSRITLEGSLHRDTLDPGELVTNLSGDLRPLSFTALRESFPQLPVTGEVAGTLGLQGPLSDAVLEADLETEAGPMILHARFDLGDPLQRYSLDTEVQGFLLSDLVPGLPEPTRLTGRVLASGEGGELDDLRGEATVFLRGGEVGKLEVDSVALVARVREGLLQVDALMAETALGRLDGGGSFGLATGAPSGELQLRVASESLAGLQPFLFGEVPVARDTLGPLERDALAFQGVDLDTLPTLEEVQVDGAALGSAVFRGGLEDFSGEGSLSFENLRYRTHFVEGGDLTFSAQGLPGARGRIRATLRTDSLRVLSLSFLRGQAEVEWGDSRARVQVAALRTEEEDYRVRGTVALDTLGGGEVNLDELTLRFDTARWNLGGPASLTWSDRGLRVRDFRFVRPGSGFMRIRADGYLAREGEVDFELEVEELNLARVARVAQLEETLEGMVEMDLRVTGSSQAPRMEGGVAVRDLRRGGLVLDGLESRLRYRDRAVSGEVTVREGGGEVLRARGSFPADLRFLQVPARIPEAPVDLTLTADSFPTRLALYFMETVEDVEGTLSGEVRLQGTPGELEPSGAFRVADGSVVIPAMGVRYFGIQARADVTPDATLALEGSLRSGEGTAEVSGNVTLDPLSDPRLDLGVDLREFRAVSRRDVRATMGGSITVDSSYSRPLVEGDLTVEEGVLQVEEFARSAGVVNLGDPAFFDVDTSLAAIQPVLRASQNPFLQNLRLDVGVTVGRGTWLRGRDLNVEMDGNLQVFWDRTERELVLVGELEAVRGIYAILGRQFQVQEGTVNFLGTPGINPNLDIEAMNRLRTAGGEERLEIVANVTGTLLSPRVSLSSNAAFPISESDLVSYLVFGRPTYALASGQSAFAEGAAGSLLGAAAGAGVTLGLGTLGNQLGSVFSQGFGLDYLAITQGQDVNPFGTTADWAGTVATTEVEIGQYLTDDIFAALHWRPLTELAGAGQSQFAGLRVEWRLADLWSLEGFVEDRLSRSPLFRSTNLKLDKVLGFFLYREWGY